ncbi:MAG: Gfo/Idh/MocA family oxidoreductase [Candidatus Sericytochromatia bacterium]|nr:Gfo/Idh/MocA family oxidoreductase [Candidatus Sericytochromatia bacterium]
MTPRIALVGAGHWGRNWARTLAGMGVLAGVWDEDAERARAVAAPLGVPCGGSLEELLVRPDVDAVVLATPVPLHVAHGLAVLESGRHVLVEKPLALDATGAERLVLAARARSLQLAVGHVLEYHPGVAALREAVRDGLVGPVRHVRARRLNLGKVRTAEDAWWSLAPHDVAMVIGVMGEGPESVTAHGLYHLGTTRADEVHAWMNFAGGRTAHIHVGWLEPEKVQECLVIGHDGMLRFVDGPDGGQLWLQRRAVHWVGGQPEVRDDGAERLPFVSEPPLEAQARAFVEAVRTGRPVRADGEAGLAVVRVLEEASSRLLHRVAHGEHRP